ncbi:leucine-rich repeat domain-containing protein, partial [Listeria monocytogenes]|nr:leucine-rich repeat domain-containing protein [Listeria monocytogenes]
MIRNSKSAKQKNWRLWKKGKHWVCGALLMGVITMNVFGTDVMAEEVPSNTSADENSITKVETIPTQEDTSNTKEESSAEQPKESNNTTTTKEQNLKATSSYTDTKGFTYTIDTTAKTAIITGYDASHGTEINIPSTANTYDVVGIADRAFQNSTITKLTINSRNFKTIGAYAFAGSQLTSIQMWEGTIGEHAFENCDSLTTATMFEAVDSIGAYAFNDCNNLTSISNYTHTIGAYAFQNCSKLSGASFYNTTSIGNYAFSGCSSLKSANMPAALKSLGMYAFQNCASLTNVYMTSSVLTEIPMGAFWGCALTSVSLPSTITNIGACAFYSNNISNYTIPSNIKTIDDSAFKDNAIKTVTIPANLNLGRQAFFSNSLEEIHFLGRMGTRSTWGSAPSIVASNHPVKLFAQSADLNYYTSQGALFFAPTQQAMYLYAENETYNTSSYGFSSRSFKAITGSQLSFKMNPSNTNYYTSNIINGSSLDTWVPGKETIQWYKKNTDNTGTLVGSGETFTLPNIQTANYGTYYAEVQQTDGTKVKLDDFVVQKEAKITPIGPDDTPADLSDNPVIDGVPAIAVDEADVIDGKVTLPDSISDGTNTYRPNKSQDTDSNKAGVQVPVQSNSDDVKALYLDSNQYSESES